jgi:hypothetical protein
VWGGNSYVSDILTLDSCCLFGWQSQTLVESTLVLVAKYLYASKTAASIFLNPVVPAFDEKIGLEEHVLAMLLTSKEGFL